MAAALAALETFADRLDRLEIGPLELIELLETSRNPVGPAIPKVETRAILPRDVYKVAEIVQKVQADAAIKAGLQALPKAEFFGECLEAWLIGHIELNYRVTVAEFLKLAREGRTADEIFKFGCDRRRNLEAQKLKSRWTR